MTKLNIQNVSILDRGVSYAEACFETFRVIDGLVFEASNHQCRLQQGTLALGIELGDSALQDVWKACLEVASECANDSLIRVTITGGDAPWGLFPTDTTIPNVYIQAQPFMHDDKPTHLQSVSWSSTPQSKQAKFTSDYAEVLRHWRRWRRWKNDLAADVMPLICDEGQIFSGMTANVYLLRSGQWFTPSVGILSGIVRQVLLDSGKVQACECPVSWLDDCEAMALSNSGMFIRTVSSINGRTLEGSNSVLVDVLRNREGVPEFD